MEREGKHHFEGRDVREGRFIYGHFTEARNSERPQANEDRSFVEPEIQAAGVFDGLGGYEHSEEAARVAAEQFRELMASWPKDASRKQILELFRQTILDTQRAILKNFSWKTAERGGSATTATVVKLLERDSAVVRAIIGNVGDSRAWIRRNNGLLELLTVDNTSEETPDERIGESKKFQERMSRVGKKEDFESRDPYSPHDNMVSGPFGSSGLHFRIYQAEFNPGEFLLLTTDGIHDNLTIQEMEELIEGEGENSPSEIAERLVQAAGERSRQDHLRAKPDDRTAVVLRYPEKNLS